MLLFSTIPAQNRNCLPDPSQFTIYKGEAWAYLIFGILSTFVFLAIAFLWIKRIHFFPIRERSPYMSLLGLFFIWLDTIIIPINLMVFSWENFIPEDSLYVHFMIILNLFSLSGIYTNFVLRGVRLYYVVATNYTYRCMDEIMKKERYLICINIFVSLLFGLLSMCYKASDVPFEIVIYFADFQMYEQMNEITSWEVSLCIIQFIFEAFLIFIVYKLKRIKPGYNIVKELVMTVFTMVVSNFIYYLLYHMLENKIEWNLVIMRINVSVRNWFFLYFSYIHTIRLSHYGRTPPTSYIVFQELRYFLYDHTCVTVFHEFIKKRHPDQANAFLFYLDFVSQRVDPKQLFKEYYLDGDCKIEGIHPVLLERVKEEYEENDEFTFENMIELRDLIYEGLELRFTNYKKTRSCSKLMEEFEYHDVMTERLFAYNMESFNMQI